MVNNLYYKSLHNISYRIWKSWNICKARNSLICSSLLCSFAHFAQIKWASVSYSLRLLKIKEQPWANHSGRSRKLSDREQIAQVAHDKWMTLSDSLRSLMINERMSDLLNNCWLKTSKILFFSKFYIRFFI